MQKRAFGKTGEEISVLGLGCMRFPTIGADIQAIDEEKVQEMIRLAVEGGVNYIDTAWPYHGGASEPVVGRALQTLGIRDEIFLATKLPSWLIHSREDMNRYLDQQLERLQTDHIDYYLVHTLTKRLWAQVKEHGIFEFLDEALASGKIRHVGFSFHDSLDLFQEIVDAYPWEFCQIQLNYLDERYQAGIEGLEYAAGKGLSVIIMEPLRGGKLVNNLPEEALDLFAQSAESKTPAAWGLRYLWNRPEVTLVLSGMSNLEQIQENLETAQHGIVGNLSGKDLEILNGVQGILKEKILVDCTGCKYCVPCPSGVDIPGCFEYYNNASLFSDEAGAKDGYYRFVSADHAASKCVECGICESHCPQGIAIREELKKVAELFGE